MSSEAIKVTVSDPDTGEVLGEQIVDDDYVLSAVRADLLARAREAHAEYHRCVDHFSAPYSGREAEKRMDEAHGYWLGLWRSIEVLDALAVSPCTPESKETRDD